MNHTARLAAIKKKMGASKRQVIAISRMNDDDSALFSCYEFDGRHDAHYTEAELKAEADRRGVELQIMRIIRASDHIAAQQRATELQNE